MTGAPMPEENAPTRLQLYTHFGAFELRVEDIVSFPTGLPGFEAVRRFVILASSEMAPLQCLQSVDGPSPSFLVVDPRLVLEGYRTRLNQSDLVRLGVTDDASLVWLAIVTVGADGAFVNLRAPVVINPERMLGFQLVPSDSLYPLRHPLDAEQG
jgi:flagellar assembly factor FliW